MLQTPREEVHEFHLLIAPIGQVLIQIKNKGALTFLGKLKGDPNKRSSTAAFTVTMAMTLPTTMT